MAIRVVLGSEAQPSNSEIADPTEKRCLYEEMCRLWNLTPREAMYNPCCTPVSASRDEMISLARGHGSEYVVGAKIDGVRYLLMMTEDRTDPDNPVPIAVMIDRNLRMFEIAVWAGDEYYERGLLVDGELVADESGARTFHVFDAMNVRGANVCGESYMQRLTHVYAAFTLQPTRHEVPMHDDDEVDLSWVADERKVVAAHDYPSLRLVPKRAVAVENIRDLLQDASTDGYVFTRVADPVRTGRARDLSIVKWKPPEMNTIDLMFSASGECLCASGDGRAIPLRPIQLSGAAFRFRVAPSAETLAHAPEERIVYECAASIAHDEKTVCVRPTRVRRDKSAPNTLRTILSTIDHLLEQVTHKEIVGICARRDEAGL